MTPSAVEAASSPASPAAVAAPVAAGPTPDLAMCRPEPPDYPGCSPAQVRPLQRALFAREYTGHAFGYRFYRMGQHPRGVIFAHLLPSLDAKLARLYRQAVERYAAQHAFVVVGDDGVRRTVASYPRFRTWAAFRDNTTALCSANNVTVRFPYRYCWAITKIGQAGAVIDKLLHDTLHIVFSCDGYAIGGWSSGAYMAWRMGTGVLRGGYYGAVGTEIGCQTKNLWNWVSGLW